jgi:uncharacterized membrane protein
MLNFKNWDTTHRVVYAALATIILTAMYYGSNGMAHSMSIDLGVFLTAVASRETAKDYSVRARGVANGATISCSSLSCIAALTATYSALLCGEVLGRTTNMLGFIAMLIVLLLWAAVTTRSLVAFVCDHLAVVQNALTTSTSTAEPRTYSN